MHYRMVVLTWLFMAEFAVAGTSQLTWTPSSSPDLAGNNVYRMLGACSLQGPLQKIAAVGLVAGYTDATVPIGTTGAHYEVTAFDASGNESARSNHVCKVFVAGPIIYVKQATDSLGHLWGVPVCSDDT